MPDSNARFFIPSYAVTKQIKRPSKGGEKTRISKADILAMLV